METVKIEGHLVEAAALHGQLGEVHDPQRGVLLRCHAGNEGVGFGHAAVAHHRTAGLDDARLGRGDVGDGGAQLLDMIHSQRRDDRTLRRVDDIGGVQRAAEAHFQHHDVALLFGKVEHSQRCDDLKLSGDVRHRVGGGPDLLHQPHQFFVADLFAVHLDALVEPVDERRGVQPHAIARRPQTGRQHGRGAALAVGTRHMDELQPLVGAAQRGQ